MGEDRKLRVVEVPVSTLDTIYDNVRKENAARLRAERDAAVWHEAWLDLLGQVGDLYHRAKGRPKGRRFATVLELENLLRVDDDLPRPTVQVMDGETGEESVEPCAAWWCPNLALLYGASGYLDPSVEDVPVCRPAPTPRAKP